MGFCQYFIEHRVSMSFENTVDNILAVVKDSVTYLVLVCGVATG